MSRARTPSASVLYALGIALILGLLLQFYWPTLHDGLFADDFVATAILDGRFAAPRAPLDLFNFADGTPQDVQALRQLGSLPWWAPDDFRIAFMRPLSSALWHADRALFGSAYGAYHAHSLLVFFALIVCAGQLYRQLFTPVVALVATLIFAVDDSHHFPVVWLSNRGGIYALLLGVLALHWHVRFRSSGRPLYAALSALATSIGLLFGEWALAMLAYVAAYELVVVSGPLRKRALALLPNLIPSAVFVIVRGLLHYGARGSGAYVDPAAEPLRFALAVCQRLPVFIGDMVWNVPSEWWDHGTPWRDALLRMWVIPPSIWLRLPDWRFFQVALGLLGLIALLLGLAFCRKGLTESERKHVRFLVLGALASLVPVVGSFPSTRLTIAAFWGVSPVFALVLREITRRLRALPLRPRSTPAFVAHGLVVGAIVHMQMYTPLQSDVQAQVDFYAATAEWVKSAELDPIRLPAQRVFLLAGSEFTSTFFFSYIWSHAGRPLPRSYYPLTACPCSHYVQRTADNQLVLRALGGSYLSSGEESMFQSPRRIWHEGERVLLDGLSIQVERIVDGAPGILRMTFARSLDDPSYVFLHATPYGLVRLQLPAVGEQQLLTRAGSPNWPELQRHKYLSRIAPVPEWLFYGSYPGFVEYKPAE